MKKFSLFLILTVFLSGCATTKGPEPKGPDTFVVKGISDFGPESAERKALKKAVEFAEAKGKVAVLIDSKTEKAKDFMGDKVDINVLTFRLASENDPEYHTAKIKYEKKLSPKQDNAQTDLYTSLKQLKELKDEGILSEEEFQQEKKEILDSN